MQQTIQKLVSSFVAAVVVTFALCVPRAQSQTYKIIYSFTGGAEGGPTGGLAIDASGNLYGVTESGGNYGAGTVYELSPGSGGTWTKTEVYSFGLTTGDIYLPTSNLVFDAKGNLYGMTPAGGANGSGGIFELSPGSNGTWTEKTIYSFTGGTDIVSFQSALAIDSGSNLYGYLGSAVFSNGTSTSGGVFELESESNGTWTEKILHTFLGADDGVSPYGGALVVSSSGHVFGMASGGPHDYGIVFELAQAAPGVWNEKIVHVYKGGADGSYGFGGPMAIDPAGNVFGTSTWSVIELVPGTNGTWTKKILHNFAGGRDGAYPEAGLTLANSGKLFGTTNQGGARYGTVFELAPDSNGTWTERILHRFTPSSGDGFYPSTSSVVVDKQGNVYGTVNDGGFANAGIVFEVTP